MRAVWGPAEYREMAQHWLDFTSTQEEALRQAVPVAGERLARLR
ncbi:MAG: hypothetical protein ABSC93_32500 [Bryobacteraceae bacterium]